MLNHKNHRLKAIYVLCIAVSAAFAGCRENTLISSKVSPANDTAGVRADTLNCITHTYFDNDLYTSLNIQGLSVNAAVGSTTDSFFGTMQGAAYFQVVPQTVGVTFGDTSLHIDSVFLIMPYSGFTYGDSANTTLTQSYQVFYLGDTLGYNTIYYPNAEKRLDLSTPLSAPVTVNLHSLNDSLKVNGTNYHPGLRIKLNKNAIMAKINAALFASSAATDKTLTFLNTFNGICVRPADSRTFTKAIPYFQLDGNAGYSEAGIIMHYHNTAQEAKTFEFYFAQSSCAHYNGIVKSYSRFPLNNLINSGKANDELIALQNQPGASIDLKAYGLTSKIPKGVIINKATLQISVITPGGYSYFAPPDQIFTAGIGNGTYPVGIDAGKEYPIEDRKPLTSLAPYIILDGTSHTITYGTTNITTYTIGMPREVMANIAAQNDTLHLHIHGSQVYYGAFQMLAAGGNYPDSRYKTKLIVVHSTLKN
ncbi:MAG: DUF4270 family protein [Taibaiella sp.]|nr:DUF4270 family protein [Taibaiella sp.]